MLLSLYGRVEEITKRPHPLRRGRRYLFRALQPSASGRSCFTESIKDAEQGSESAKRYSCSDSKSRSAATITRHFRLMLRFVRENLAQSTLVKMQKRKIALHQLSQTAMAALHQEQSWTFPKYGQEMRSISSLMIERL